MGVYGRVPVSGPVLSPNSPVGTPPLTPRWVWGFRQGIYDQQEVTNTMPRCTLCFQERPVTPPIPGAPQTCKGCAFVITRTVGWLESSGISIQLILARTGELLSLPQMPLPAPTNSDDNPPTPRSPQKGQKVALTPGDKAVAAQEAQTDP